MLIKTQRLVVANAELEGDSCYLFTESSLDHLMGALEEYPDEKFIIFYLCVTCFNERWNNNNNPWSWFWSSQVTLALIILPEAQTWGWSMLMSAAN